MYQELTANCAHVWCVSLDRSSETIARLSGYLTPAELERATKFINPIHRDRWIAARGYLRQILSNYLAIDPADIALDYTELGKPYIRNSAIKFNLSHSADLAAYAIGIEHVIGIDIECTRSLPFSELVERFFSASERATFRNLPPDLHPAAFFHAWTQKEAYLKACGTGLHTPLDRISVSIDPRTPAQILNFPRDLNPDTNWQIERLTLPAEYVGAIAIAGNTHTIAIEYRTI